MAPKNANFMLNSISTIASKQEPLDGFAGNVKYRLTMYGSEHWLLQLDESTDYTFLLQLETNINPIVEETILGYDSLLLRVRSGILVSELQAHIESFKISKDMKRVPILHEIPVHYDGPDLTEVAAYLGLKKDRLIALHSGGSYVVRCLGFSPGFGYLNGLPTELAIPRRNTPRTIMAKGAVAIGGAHTGIYTVPSPGGWNWLGNTDYPLFDPTINTTDAFALKPGDRIKFNPI
jgi:KipI family sensor histidine kinase inhibitor